MSLTELLASIKERRRRSEQQSGEEGAQIIKRVQELLAVPTPSQRIETQPATMAVRANEREI